MMMISVKSLLACFGLLLFMNVAVAQSQTVNMQECDIWARISDSDILTEVGNSCPCDDTYTSRNDYLGCIIPALQALMDRGSFGGPKGLSYWSNLFKHRYYLQNDCGPLWADGDPRNGVFDNNRPGGYNDARIFSTSSDEGGARRRTQELPISSATMRDGVIIDNYVNPYGGPQCQLTSTLSDTQITSDISNRCPCDGRWTSRAEYMHSCVEGILDSWSITGNEIQGSKNIPYWYNFFKYTVYLDGDCGYLFARTDARYGDPEDGLRT